MKVVVYSDYVFKNAKINTRGLPDISNDPGFKQRSSCLVKFLRDKGHEYIRGCISFPSDFSVKKVITHLDGTETWEAVSRLSESECKVCEWTVFGGGKCENCERIACEKLTRDFNKKTGADKLIRRIVRDKK